MSQHNEAIAEVTLSYKPTLLKLENLPAGISMTNSRQLFDVLFNYWDQSQIGYRESFKVVLMNRSNMILGILNVSEGGHSATVVDAKMIIQAAILSHACSIVLAHNHPSGNTRPSEADIKLTSKIKQGADYFDISVLDHFIITPQGDYYSFADNGQM